MTTLRLRHVAQINPPTREFDAAPENDVVTFIPLEAVWRNSLDVSRTRLKVEVEQGYTRFREGDLLVPKITPTFEADRSTFATGLRGGFGTGTTELHVIRCGPLVEPRYVGYLVSSAGFIQGGEAEMIGVAGQKRVPDSWLRNYPIPIADRGCQLGVADFLDSGTARIDALIARKHRLIDLLDECKTSIMHAAAAGILTHPGAFDASSLEWLDERPSHWREALLRLVARTGSGHTPSRERPEWWVDCTIPWITTGEVAQVRSDEQEMIYETRECISLFGLANSSAMLHPEGTVVLCRTASAGYSAIMGRRMATSQDFATWTCGNNLRPRFLLLCLRAMRADLLGRLAMGSTHQTIYMPDLHAVRIPLPPLDEQDQIIAAAWSRLRLVFAAAAPSGIVMSSPAGSGAAGAGRSSVAPTVPGEAQIVTLSSRAMGTRPPARRLLVSPASDGPSTTTTWRRGAVFIGPSQFARRAPGVRASAAGPGAPHRGDRAHGDGVAGHREGDVEHRQHPSHLGDIAVRPAGGGLAEDPDDGDEGNEAVHHEAGVVADRPDAGSGDGGYWGGEKGTGGCQGCAPLVRVGRARIPLDMRCRFRNKVSKSPFPPASVPPSRRTGSAWSCSGCRAPTWGGRPTPRQPDPAGHRHPDHRRAAPGAPHPTPMTARHRSITGRRFRPGCRTWRSSWRRRSGPDVLVDPPDPHRATAARPLP